MSTPRNILLGITGGIAAYKSCELCRLFIKSGDNVKVVMTKHAKQFIHPNTFAALSNHIVYDDLFDDPMVHIELAKWADKIIIAPATASIIGKIAHGIADDLLSTIILATTAALYLAPAMNKIMWDNIILQKNLQILQENQWQIIQPDSGEQACGDIGPGRMAEPNQIFQTMQQARIFTHKTIVITAGPTHERIDPVRYISNDSSGKMGYALANAAQQMGANVILISGPTHLTKPNNVTNINITTAKHMLDAVHQYIDQADIFISAAAVADYTPTNTATQKIKKTDHTLQLHLQKTTDILSSIADKKAVFKVGFCAETENLIQNAKQKLTSKHLDAIIANQVETNGFPFHADENSVTYLAKEKEPIQFPKQHKQLLAEQLLMQIAATIAKSNEPSMAALP